MFKTCWVAQPPVLLQFSLLFASLSLAAPMALLWEVINSSYRSLTKTHIFKGARTYTHTHMVAQKQTCTCIHVQNFRAAEKCVSNFLITSRLQSKQLVSNTAQTDSLLTQHFLPVSKPCTHTPSSSMLIFKREETFQEFTSVPTPPSTHPHPQIENFFHLLYCSLLPPLCLQTYLQTPSSTFV